MCLTEYAGHGDADHQRTTKIGFRQLGYVPYVDSLHAPLLYGRQEMQLAIDDNGLFTAHISFRPTTHAHFALPGCGFAILIVDIVGVSKSDSAGVF